MMKVPAVILKILVTGLPAKVNQFFNGKQLKGAHPRQKKAQQMRQE